MNYSIRDLWELISLSGLFIMLSFRVCGQDATVFQPILPQKQVQATEIKENLTINGRLEEADWLRAKPGMGFFQVQPNQGKPLTHDTQVRVLYNRKFLYIGAFCPDPLGKKGTRVPDLRRDFDYFSNDLVGISLDPFLDRRNAQVFQTNPFSAQRDLLAFDDNFYDRDWDGFWKVRTTRSDSGWTAEMQIPWATLRYPKANRLTDSTQSDLYGADTTARDNRDGGPIRWGVNFVRIARRLNEQSYWSPVPRAYTVYRMSYGGLLTGLKPPPPSVNIRVQPYILGDYNRQFLNGQVQGETFKPKVGGEVKWAVNPFTVLDLTANTDFAQADADRQVQNLTRFSILFPERRQFFLENASLFSIGDATGVTPFFSRRIGLSDPNAGSLPLPIDFGARLVSRTPKRSVGGLLVKQRGINGLPDIWFGVGRYSQNFGEQNRVGGLITVRYDLARDSLKPVTNYTYSADAFFRLSQPLSYYAMGSRSSTQGAPGNGWSVVSQLTYSSNQWYAYQWESLVSRDYNPGVGFAYGSDILNTSFGGYRITRPTWRPKLVRQLDPGMDMNIYHQVSTGKFQQAEWEIYPLYLVSVKGGTTYFYVVPTWQQLDDTFSPLGIDIKAGSYYYTRYRFSYATDPSAKLALKLYYETGRYYDGRLNTFTTTLRYSPLPQASFTLDYTRNIAHGLGSEKQNKTTELITPTVRLALNPRLQLIGFYQKNTNVNRDVWNVRLAWEWEFQPLSFLYIVYNNNSTQYLNDALKRTDINRNEQVIGKLTYLKQF